MKMLMVSALCAMGLTGCITDEDRMEAAAQTEYSFSNPQTVGTLKDGRTVSYVVRVNADRHDHYIYFVSGNSGVTINRGVQQGKTTALQTVASLPGVTSESDDKATAEAEADRKLEEAARLVAEAKALLGQ